MASAQQQNLPPEKRRLYPCLHECKAAFETEQEALRHHPHCRPDLPEGKLKHKLLYPCAYCILAYPNRRDWRRHQHDCKRDYARAQYDQSRNGLPMPKKFRASPMEQQQEEEKEVKPKKEASSNKRPRSAAEEDVFTLAELYQIKQEIKRRMKELVEQEQQMQQLHQPQLSTVIKADAPPL